MIDKATLPARLISTDLKARGWTDGLIRRFLPEPDATRPNPMYRKASPIRLYDLARVEAIKATAAFTEAAHKARARKDAATRAVETKLAKLRAAITAMPVDVEAMDRETLVRRACIHFNARLDDRAYWRDDIDWTPATATSDPAFLDRIMVNYIRHEVTDYDGTIDDTAGRVGVELAYRLINRRVYDAIAVAYPELARECDRQFTAKFGTAP